MWQLTPSDLPELPEPGLPWWGIAGIVMMGCAGLLSMLVGAVKDEATGGYTPTSSRRRLFRCIVWMFVVAVLSILSSFVVKAFSFANDGEISDVVQKRVAEDYGLEVGEMEARAIVPDERSVLRPRIFRDEVDGELVSILMKLDPMTGEYYLETRDGERVPPLRKPS